VVSMDKPEVTIDWDAVDWESVDEAALAIMLLGLHEGWRTWKGFDWEVLNRLHDKGFITDPKTKAKSVIFTEKGLEESHRLFERLFGHKRISPNF
jgi:Domain of unknown function (DUF6429)